MQIFRPENFDSLYQDNYFRQSEEWLFDGEGRFIRFETLVEDPEPQEVEMSYMIDLDTRSKAKSKNFKRLSDLIKDSTPKLDPLQIPNLSSDENSIQSNSENE